jgi:hypothetical protein
MELAIFLFSSHILVSIQARRLPMLGHVFSSANLTNASLEQYACVKPAMSLLQRLLRLLTATPQLHGGPEE